jgi:predicted  nucleic acid-binding Zn-ribbon protein
LLQRDRSVKDLETSLEDTQERFRRKAEEADRLRDDIKLQADQLSAQQTRLKEVQSLFSELQGKHMPVEYELLKIKHENESLKSQVEWFDTELKRKQADEFEMRSSLSQTISELESALTISKSDNMGLRESVSRLQEQLSLQNEKSDEYSAKVRSLELEMAEKYSDFELELDIQKRLSDSYKNHFEEAANKIKELESTIIGIREASSRSFENLKEKMQAKLEKAEAIITEQSESASAKEDELLSRIRELENDPRMKLSLTEYEESVEVGPFSHSADKVNVIPDDFSCLDATAMYDRVVVSERRAQFEQSKRRDAELYLNQILVTMEQKTPIIAAQRRLPLFILITYIQIYRYDF